jgi:radical SAM superfamily enzyme YgiQ (UPF0313 family)
MRVLLINPPYEESTYISPPLGLAYIASMLRVNDHTVQVVDAPALKYDYSGIIKEIKKFSPEIVGLSAMTPTIQSAVKTAKMVKSIVADIPIIMGGVHPSIMPDETLKNTKEIDILVRGEGEKTAEELINIIESGGNIYNVSGISFRDNNRVVHNQNRPLIKNLDSIPFPARDLLPMGKYKQHIGNPTSFATIITSRGCPFNCIYCTKAIFGRIYRFRSAENVLREIEEIIHKYKVKEIDFYDDSFTVNKKRVTELCDAIIKCGIDVQWKCEARVDLVNKELLEKMKKAGCYLIAYGVETGNQELLDILKKGVTIDQIRKAFKITKEVGIETLAYIMIGIPGETRKTIKKTLNFTRALDPDYAQIAVLTPYPQTELYEMVKEKGHLIKEDWSKYAYVGDSATAVIRTDELSPEDLADELKRITKAFYLRPKYILKQLRKSTSAYAVKRNISGLKSILKWVK